MFAKSEAPFAGYILLESGVKPVASKVYDIVDFKPATSVDSLHTFLDMASYYRTFVECFAIKAVPLYALLKKRADFLWSEDCEKAFLHKGAVGKCKNSLSSRFLKAICFTNSCIKWNDVGFVLSQEKNGMM